MRKLIRDSENNIAVLISVNGFIPEGWTEVPPEELETEELLLARRNKISLVRAKRNDMLISNDKLWLIASKKGEDTTAIESDAQILRDLPETVEGEIDLLETVEEINTYDAFAELELSQSYE